MYVRRNSLALASATFLFGLLIACGGTSTTSTTTTTTANATAAPASTAMSAPTAVPVAATDGAAKLTKAVLTTGIDAEQHPVDETSSFKQKAEIFLQLTFEGRPKKGIVRAELMYQGEKATDSQIDLSDVNGGVIASIGQDTFANFNFTQTKPFPISDKYRIDAYLDDAKIGSYPFAIVAADGSTTTAATAQPAASATGPAHAIGEPVTIGNLIVTVNGTEILKSDETSKPDAGNMFIAIDVSIKNTGTEKQVIASLLQMTVVDGAGKKYDFDLLASILAGDTPDGDLAPGATKQGKVGFQVPEDASGLQLRFEDLIEGNATFNIQPNGASNTTKSTADVKTTALGPLKQYIHSSGIFAIDLPGAWENSTEQNTGIVKFAAYPSDRSGGVLVIVTQSKKQLDAKQQAAHLQDMLKSAYGDQADFALGEVEKQDDDSQLISVNYTTSGTKVQGGGYVWQTGDKLVVLYTFADADSFDTLWDGGLSDIVNSIQIDETAPFTL